MKLRSAILALWLLCNRAFSFCGFYVAKADASLYNKASQVVMVHHENKTAITMYSDFKGELKDFALVVPVPEVLTREQINVADRALIERIDAFTAPRLVEYFDPDPCVELHYDMMRNTRAMMKSSAEGLGKPNAAALGVKVEAQYTVGEYDIVILSAKESDGLETWLTQSGYKLPKGASKALRPYIKTNMKFFVAKVNLAEQAKTGFTFLRPLQFAFESPKFMLPIRLGMVNADGPQDMLIYAITRKGRVETTNYRTVKMPSEQNIPLYIKEKDKFSDFYRATFDTAFKKENQKVLMQEYAWNMNWCDPCAAEPLSSEELRKLGVFWLDDNASPNPPGVRPGRKVILPMPGGGQNEAFVTRLHVRYDREHFSEDLAFQETSDSQNFQGRYVLNHPFTGEIKCNKADSYKKTLVDRRQEEARNLAMLTGWKMDEIWKEMGGEKSAAPEPTKKWYQKIFK